MFNKFVTKLVKKKVPGIEEPKEGKLAAAVPNVVKNLLKKNRSVPEDHDQSSSVACLSASLDEHEVHAEIDMGDINQQ